ncbi:MAG: DAK2 domain-containing protein, partial [Acidimicrobiales bacterium]
MTSPTALRAEGLRAAMVAYRDVLRAHREALNRLNVFPVPDGDTGTNMALTVEAVVRELDERAGVHDMASVCKAVAHGSLMGARGNSGVILSQLLRGLCEQLSGVTEGGAGTVASAFVVASDLATKAVARPVEGTILTVARAAGEGATAAFEEGEALLGVVERAKHAAADALAQTPTMLEALARAGVVDAGGAGYVLLFDALLAALDGRALPEPDGPRGGDRPPTPLPLA